MDVRAEAEEALAARFGRPVPLRLVLDPGARPLGRPREPTPEPGRPAGGAGTWIDLDDAGPAVTSPEQRLLEAFPGAEEVSS